MIKKRYLFILACYSLVNWLSVSGNVFDEIKQALGAVSPGAQAQDSKIEEISKKIVDFDFNEESRQSLTDIVNKFLDWQKFPAQISQAINDAIKKWADSFSARETNLKIDQEKIEYNRDVNIFRTFVKKINKISINLIPLTGLPKEVEIKPAWQTAILLNENHKIALKSVKKLVTQGLKQSELESAKNSIKLQLNTLNGICGVKGALTKYLDSDDGKKDADFIGILLQTKEILKNWFPEDNNYKKLKTFLDKAPELPAKPETPPPLPPRKDKLKAVLTKLKTGLSNLKNKLKTLTDKLNVLRNNIAEASIKLGKFKNTETWWQIALKNKSKIMSEHEEAINLKWEDLYVDMEKALENFKGASRDRKLAEWVGKKILNKPENKMFIENIKKVWPTWPCVSLINKQLDLDRVSDKLKQLSTEPSE